MTVSAFKNRDSLLAAVVLILIAAITVRAPAFLWPLENFVNVFTDTSFLFMLTLAQMAVILTRGIDLSVASTLSLIHI